MQCTLKCKVRAAWDAVHYTVQAPCIYGNHIVAKMKGVEKGFCALLKWRVVPSHDILHP